MKSNLESYDMPVLTGSDVGAIRVFTGVNSEGKYYAIPKLNPDGTEVRESKDSTLEKDYVFIDFAEGQSGITLKQLLAVIAHKAELK